jgi:hypothetical protein
MPTIAMQVPHMASRMASHGAVHGDGAQHQPSGLVCATTVPASTPLAGIPYGSDAMIAATQ